MIPSATDTDGTHPLERIAESLESIAFSLQKIVNPPFVAKDVSEAKINRLPGEFTRVG